MDDILRIKSGSFQAEIVLDKLPRLPLANIKKLFHLLVFGDPWENRDTIDGLDSRLQRRINNAKRDWAIASQDYTDGRKFIPQKRKYDPFAEQRRENERLIRAVKSTKARYDRWVKIKSIFEGEKNL